MQMHSQLVDELVDDRERGIIRKRAVRIAGSDYEPLASPMAIEEELDRIIEEQTRLSNPLERAVYLHCNIAKLQPFIDGNKRTARLAESIVLMNEDIIPIFSTNNIDINDYRTGVLYFYETGEYTRYADYFLQNKLKYLQKYTDKDLMINLQKQ